MTGLLVMLGLLALIVGVFVSQFRKRAAANLQRAGLEMPAELLQRTAAAPARRTPVTAPPPDALAARAMRPLHFMLIYDVGPDFLQQRAQHRDEHLALAWRAADAGELVLAGALEESAGQAFLLFRGTRSAAERFARSDPYVRHGLVRQWRVAQWHTTVGEAASLPARPSAPPAQRAEG